MSATLAIGQHGRKSFNKCATSVDAAETIRVILPLLTGSGPANSLSPPTV